MNEIFIYIGNNRRRVSVGYKLPNGQVIRVARKIDGDNQEAIMEAIMQVKDMGANDVIVEIYRPNGTAEVIAKIFTLPASTIAMPHGKINNKVGTMGSLFSDQMPKPQYPRPSSHQSQPNKPMDSWKDYALKTEQDKVTNLETENTWLKTENKTLDNKVREFEKEMIKKDHEVEKMSQAVESKTGLNGITDRVLNNDRAMDMLAGLASRMMGLPVEGVAAQGQLNAPASGSGNPTTEQYLANIRTWLYKQSAPLQEAFYNLVHELTNQPDVMATTVRITNLLKGNTMKTGTHDQ